MRAPGSSSITGMGQPGLCSVLGPVGHGDPHPVGPITDQEDPRDLTEPCRRHKGQDHIPLWCTLPAGALHSRAQLAAGRAQAAKLLLALLPPFPCPCQGHRAHTSLFILNTSITHQLHRNAAARAMAEKQRVSSVVLNYTLCNHSKPLEISIQKMLWGAALALSSLTPPAKDRSCGRNSVTTAGTSQHLLLLSWCRGLLAALITWFHYLILQEALFKS